MEKDAWYWVRLYGKWQVGQYAYTSGPRVAFFVCGVEAELEVEEIGPKIEPPADA